MLTGKKRLYAAARLAGKNRKDSAIVAGYSAATASPAASRLEKDPDVIAYLSRNKKQHEPVKAKPQKLDPTPEAAKEPEPVKVPEPVEQKAEPVIIEQSIPYRRHSDPKDFLLDLMNDPQEDPRLKADAAKALLPYMHQKKGEEGKKEAKEREAKETGAGKFALGVRPANVRPIK